MATNYPNSLDSLTNPTTNDPVNNPSHAVQHANANDAIEALQTKVGTNNSAVETSLDYRIKQLELNPGVTQSYVDAAISNLSNTSSTTYVPQSDVGQVDGVASLDSTGKIPDAQIPDGIARDSEVSTAIANLVNSAPSTLDTLNELATALGNDANFSTTITNSIGGKVSKSGGDTITSSTASTKGLIIQGAASQTANLQEWQVSSGSIVAQATPYVFQVGPNNAYPARLMLGANDTSALLSVSTHSATEVGAVIRAAASQSADLQQWQNSAGTLMARVAADGSFTAGGANGATKFIVDQFGTLSLGTNRNLTGTPTYLFVQSQFATDIGAVIKGAASQTADLQQWQNSSGTVLAKIRNDGVVFGGELRTTNNRVMAREENSGGTLTQQKTTSTPANPGSGFAKIYLRDGTNAGTLKLVVIAGASGGAETTVLDNIDQSFGTASSYLFTAPATGSQAVIVKGAASQTANLQEWQNSSGTVLSHVRPDGTVAAPYFDNPAANGAYIQTVPGESIAVVGRAVGLPTFRVKAAASQTANLQQWQNSAGTVLANIDAKGSFSLNAQSPTTNLISISQNSLTKFEINQYSQSWNSTKSTFGQYYNTDTGTLPQVSIITEAAEVKGLIIRGRASQTANLQEWQNSAGTVLAKITSTGAFDATAITVNGSPISASGGGLTSFTISSNTSLSSDSKYFVDTSAARTLTLPASPSVGDEIQIFDASGTAATNNITILRNGNKINGLTEDAIIDVDKSAAVLIYTGSTLGWRLG